MLLLYACVPQVLLFADQLPLLLVARRRIESLALWGASWISFTYWYLPLPSWGPGAVESAAPYAVVGVYWTALGVVLLRPNVGIAPAAIERVLKRVPMPAWVRGTDDTEGTVPVDG
jgi:hypothetical protein